jgi:hypothetical protein
MLRVFTILSSKQVTISLEIKLNTKVNLSNGKGNNSITTEKIRKTLSGPYSQYNLSVFVPLRMEPGRNINRTIVEKSLRFPTVIYTPQYDKRSKSYEFLYISQGAVSPC